MSIANPDIFQAISDPSRRQMLQLLSAEPMTINTLARNFDMSRPAVSKHLKLLEMGGFIVIVDVGRERHCSLKEDGFRQLKDWMKFYDTFWSDKLNKLGKLLDNQ